MANSWTSLQLLQWTTDYFKKVNIPNPRLDAELLLSYVLKCQRVELYVNHENKVSEKDRDRFKKLIQRRSKREPLPYIIGNSEFYGRTFKVNPSVLCPRPETELLVEEALKTVMSDSCLVPSEKKPMDCQILEIGTGSGCIAITLAKEIPQAKIISTDISKEAIEIAKQNAKLHEVESQIDFVLSDIAPWNQFKTEEKKFDFIISNPPYIASQEIENLEPEVSQFEPKQALDGGADGLDFFKKILQEGKTFLVDKGVILCEVGENQGENLLKLFEKFSLSDTVVKKDYQGFDRIALGKHNG